MWQILLILFNALGENSGTVAPCVAKNLNGLRQLWKTFELLLPFSITIDFYSVAGPAYPNYLVNVGIAKRKPKNEHYTAGSDCFTTTEMCISFLHSPLGFYTVHYEEVRCIKFPGRVFFCHYDIIWNMQQFSWYEELVNFPINCSYTLFESCQIVLGSRKEQ